MNEIYTKKGEAICQGKYLGVFANEELAAATYEKYARRVFGEFHRTQESKI